MRSIFVGALLAVAATASLSLAQPAIAPAIAPSAHDRPVLAYYYIWFDPSSWNRAKTDLPLLGKYSSDDVTVLRQHVLWAKQAGIDGFIVSWKHTPTLDRRLALLVGIAEQEHFALEIIYQGLDFDRKPQPVERVVGDLQFFSKTFASRSPFKLFRKPLVIWSGTWMYNTADVARVTQAIRPTAMVLASEKNVAGYQRLAHLVDGDAYYWSSVNPSTNRGYLEKLDDLSNAVHRQSGFWLAPAAAGFDARKIGGTTVVERDNGAVLQRELTAASASAPDALGVISWNEFSENSHVEPSKQFGFRYLDVLASSLGRQPSFPAAGSDSTDSSSPGSGGPPAGLIVAPAMLALALGTALVAFRRSAPGRRGTKSRSRMEEKESKRLARARRRRRRRSGVRLHSIGGGILGSADRHEERSERERVERSERERSERASGRGSVVQIDRKGR